MADKYVEYDGILFCLDARTGYYLNGTTSERLHRYVWEHEAGPIPRGFQVHHIDRDKTNNSIDNLCLVSEVGHQRLHAMLEPNEEVKARRLAAIEKARAAACEWHKSEEGRAWHSQQAKEIFRNMEPVTFTCLHCGKQFEALPVGKHIYCSNACRSAARRKRGDDNETRICPICGKEFTANKYSETRFCSRKCMGINRSLINERKREAGEPVRKKKVK
jgi:endogenous inhibitor of DNA gyrase (YacG/DUF329 family)